MTDLYVANCTKQNLDFIYKVPEDVRGAIRMISVPMGGQTLVVRGVGVEVAKAIVAQHEMYGLIDVSSIDQSRAFTGYCYSFDKGIPVDRIMQVHERNEDVLIKRGQQLRADSLAALSQTLADGYRQGMPRVENLQAEVVEVMANKDDIGMEETIEVNHSGQAPAAPRPGKAKGARNGRGPRQRLG